MRLRRSWSSLQESAKAALRSIRDRVNAAAIDVGGGKYAWGQFLDYPQENRQRGVYGTTAAVLTLALCGEGGMPRSLGGTKWLECQYTDGESRANLKQDFIKLYRLGLAAVALNSAGAASAGPLFDRLMKRRHTASGWGEYHDDASVHDNEARVMPTAFAFFTLSVYAAFRGSNEPKDVMAWLLEKFRHEPSDSAPVERALTALAAIQSGIAIDGEARRLLLDPLIWRLDRHKEIGEWYPYHYSVRLPDSDDDDVWSNNYIYFPTDAIVAETLLTTGQLDRSFVDLWEVTHYYASSTIADGAFRQ